MTTRNARRAAGGVPLGSLLILTALAGAGLVGFRLVPIYMDDYEVRSALQSSISNAWSKTDVDVQNEFQRQAVKVSSHLEEDGAGGYKEVLGLGIPNESLLIERDTVGNTISITASYDRTLSLRPVPKTFALHFHTERHGPLH